MGVAVGGVLVAGGLVAAVGRGPSVHEPETHRNGGLWIGEWTLYHFHRESIDLKGVIFIAVRNTIKEIKQRGSRFYGAIGRCQSQK